MESFTHERHLFPFSGQTLVIVEFSDKETFYSPREIILVVAEQEVEDDFPILDNVEHVVFELSEKRLCVLVFLLLHHLQVVQKFAVGLNAQLQSAIPLHFHLLVGLDHFHVVLDLIADPVNASGAQSFADKIKFKTVKAIKFQEESHRPQEIRLIVTAGSADSVISLQHTTNLSDEIVKS